MINQCVNCGWEMPEGNHVCTGCLAENRLCPTCGNQMRETGAFWKEAKNSQKKRRVTKYWCPPCGQQQKEDAT